MRGLKKAASDGANRHPYRETWDTRTYRLYDSNVPVWPIQWKTGAFCKVQFFFLKKFKIQKNAFFLSVLIHRPLRFSHFTCLSHGHNRLRLLRQQPDQPLDRHPIPMFGRRKKLVSEGAWPIFDFAGWGAFSSQITKYLGNTTVSLPGLVMLQRVSKSYKGHQISEKFDTN